MLLGLTQEFEQARVLLEGEGGPLQITTAERPVCSLDLPLTLAALHPGCPEFELGPLELIGPLPPHLEIRTVDLAREAGIAPSGAVGLPFPFEAELPLTQLVDLPLEPPDLVELLAGQPGQGRWHRLDPSNDLDMLFYPSSEPDRPYHEWQTARRPRGTFQLRLQRPEAGRAALEARLPSLRLLHGSHRLAELVPPGACRVAGHLGEAVPHDPGQIEAARHLAPDLGGDVFRPVPGRINQIPETEKERTVMLGCREPRRHPVLPRRSATGRASRHVPPTTTPGRVGTRR